MRKVLNFILICFITCFSFYYTDKIIDLSKKNDPIMIEIEKLKKEKEVSVVNGILSNNTMKVGSSGYNINTDISYEKMKKLDKFNESLLEYISIKPEIRKDDYYDKLITGKNTNKKELSLVFKTNDVSKIEEIIYILDNNNVTATFFLDGTILENNLTEINNIFNTGNTLGYFGYNKKYDEISFRYLKGFFDKNIKSISKYCLYVNDEYLDTCTKYKINTISSIVIEKDLYNYIKNNKEKGNIYEIIPNDLNIKELNSAILYLKQKGYNIVNINELLKE